VVNSKAEVIEDEEEVFDNKEVIMWRRRRSLTMRRRLSMTMRRKLAMAILKRLQAALEKLWTVSGKGSDTKSSSSIKKGAATAMSKFEKKQQSTGRR